MNPDLNTMRNNAYTATNQVADLQGSAQPMLDQLKQNLVGIFAKDNPLIGARNDALAGYLSSNANTRASLLPTNTPQVEGRALTLSPTQQDAIVTSRNAAALAPLAGYNEILKGMYGNVGDLVKNAGNIYSSTLTSAGTRAQGLMDLYKQAAAEDQFNRNLELEREKLKQKNSSGFNDELMTLLASVLGGNSQVQGATDLSRYEEPVRSVKTPAAPKVNLSGTIKAGNVPGSTSIKAPSSQDSGWALQPLVNSIGSWFGGFAQPTNNYASLNQLGLR